VEFSSASLSISLKTGGTYSLVGSVFTTLLEVCTGTEDEREDWDGDDDGIDEGIAVTET
jgi:hypothetical protein